MVHGPHSITAIAVALLLLGFVRPCEGQVTLRPAFPRLTFEAPVDIQPDRDGSGRLFIVERDGRILVFPNDSETDTVGVFLNITDRVHLWVEKGLLGLAFHPDYSENGRFFVYYTTWQPSLSRISEFHVSQIDPNVADPQSENVLLEFEQPHVQHNAGQLRFGPEGYLYIASGDGGGFQENRGTGEDLTTLLGSILRIDVDDTTGDRNYAIPPTNPFAGNEDGYREEIYAFGFRNPWRFSFNRNDFDSARVDDEFPIWLGDVGAGA